ncbi:MAG: FTR1 family protein [Myxococcales bacterium]|nr:FTR1 family protein [Myxococcales bacterium]
MRQTQQVASLVEYIAADYPGAVKDGKVLDESEYAEQRNLIEEASKLLPKLGGAESSQARLAAALQAVRVAVEAKESGALVSERCRAVRQILKEAYQLKMVPASKVSAVQAAEQYQKLCASCHGATGHAEAAAAKTMTPPPVSFFDEEKMPSVAPQLAFHALTFGLSGTAMASFDHLSAQQRWNLAFYVVGLRHGTPGQGKPSALSQHPAVAALRLADLAEQSDHELCQTLQAGGLDASRCKEALKVVRTQAPFVSSVEGKLNFDRARALLGELRGAVERGESDAAQRLAIAAYLDGVEPNEVSLRVEQPELLRKIESTFTGLRQAVDPHSGVAKAEVLRKLTEATGLLAEAEQGAGGQVAAFLASLTIALREGLEVALLIAALLAFLRKSGQAHLTRLVHLGWLLAIPAGLLTFVAVGALVSGAQRELAEGIMTLVAAAILITMTHWIIGAKEAKHWLGFLRRRVEGAGEQAELGQKLALIGLSFFAVYREAVEVVLFYRTLLVSAGDKGRSDVIWGAVLGVIVMVAVVLIVGRIGRKLNPRPVMLVSSALLSLLAIMMTGNGLHALQEGGYLGMTAIRLFGHEWSGVPMLGLHPTWQVVLGQCVVALLLIVPSLVERARRRPGSDPALPSSGQVTAS